jgi:hypothetical protein
VFLAVITILHIVRIVAGWEVVVGDWHVSRWISALLAVATGTLSFMLWKESHAQGPQS